MEPPPVYYPLLLLDRNKEGKKKLHDNKKIHITPIITKHLELTGFVLELGKQNQGMLILLSLSFVLKLKSITPHWQLVTLPWSSIIARKMTKEKTQHFGSQVSLFTWKMFTAAGTVGTGPLILVRF